MPGISLITNFDINGSFPIDSRMVVLNILERDSINPNFLYEGLRVYVSSLRISYVWQGTQFGWKIENNGIYGGSGSLPGNVTVDFGTVSNIVGSFSKHFRYQTQTSGYSLFLDNQFLRHKTTTGINTWQGTEFRQQLKYTDGTSIKDSAYISFNPTTASTTQALPGSIAFGTGIQSGMINLPVSERMRISPTGFVGIATREPLGYLQIGTNSSNSLPLVIHNAASASIGYNWYNLTSDSFFDSTRGSSTIKFTNAGEIVFSTRNPGSSSLTNIMTIKNGKVGIDTSDPKEYLQIGISSSNSRPLVFHNSDKATIGYNWFYTNTDNFFVQNRGSSTINFESNGNIHFKNRNSNTPASFTTVLTVSSQNRVGVLNANPQYTLDVGGSIYSSIDIYALQDIISGRDTKAGRIVQTTDGYYFKNSPTNYITSTGQIMSFYSNSSENLRLTPTVNFSYKETEIVNSNLTITSTGNFTNQRYSNGIIFRSTYDNEGSGIHHFQGLFSDRDMGISIVNRFLTHSRETIRTWKGGKRVQIGVPDQRITNHNFNDSLNSAQIDTVGDMHIQRFLGTINLNTPTQNYSEIIQKGSNLLRSGLQTFTITSGINTIDVEQFWTRTGRILNVEFEATCNSSVSFDIFKLPLPIAPDLPISPALTVSGTFISDRRSTADTLDILNGILVFSQSTNFAGVSPRKLDGNVFLSTETFRKLVGTYMVELP